MKFLATKGEFSDPGQGIVKFLFSRGISRQYQATWKALTHFPHLIHLTRLTHLKDTDGQEEQDSTAATYSPSPLRRRRSNT